MINKNKMSDYARSMIFGKLDYRNSLRRISSFRIWVRPLKFAIISNRGLDFKSKLSNLRINTLSNRSGSMYENDRSLDDLVAREIEPFSWGDCDLHKITLSTYTDLCNHREFKT